MAAVTQSLLSGVSLPVVRLRAGLARVADGLADRRLRHQQMRDLASFDDRELRDLGLSRSDLPAINQGVFRRD